LIANLIVVMGHPLAIAAYSVSHWLVLAYSVSHWLVLAYTVSQWLVLA